MTLLLLIESILVLFYKCFGLTGLILLDLGHRIANGKFDQLLTCFRNLVKDWKVKLNGGKLGLGLSMWDPEKDSTFKKSLKFCNRILNDLQLIKTLKKW